MKGKDTGVTLMITLKISIQANCKWDEEWTCIVYYNRRLHKKGLEYTKS